MTGAGQPVTASASGSQLGPYASGAGQLILVVGSRKLVPDLEAAFRRISGHVQRYEDERLLEAPGEGSPNLRHQAFQVSSPFC